MRPLAGVSHGNRIVWNYYAECIMGDKQINTNQFQPRGDLTVNPSTLRNNEVGVYRVQSKNPVDSITDGVLIHICPYPNKDVRLHILCNYDASIIKIRCIWYGVDRGWKAIK